MKEWITCTVKNVRQDTHDTKTITLSLEEPMPFLAGQFVMLAFAEGPLADNPKAARAYSISSPPTNTREIDLSFRLYKEGFLTPALFALQKGTKMKVRGPYGMFTLNEGEGNDLFFIAAGSGIAPIISMVRYIVEKNIPVKMTVIYADKTEKDLIARELFERYEREGKIELAFSLTRDANPAWKGERGRIDEAKIFKYLKDSTEAQKKLFFICGPPAMVNDTVAFLKKRGIRQEQIKVEKYD